MKKNQLIICTLLLITPATLIAQSFAYGIGYETQTKIFAKTHYFFNNSHAVGASVYYHFGNNKTRYYYAGLGLPYHYLTRSFNQKGYGIAIHFSLESSKSERDLRTFSFQYDNLKSGTYIDDPGKSSGTNESSYAEFSNKYQNLSIFYEYHYPKWKHVSLYYKLGIRYKSVLRHYTMSGSYSVHKPTNYTTNEKFFAPVLALGLCIEYR